MSQINIIRRYTRGAHTLIYDESGQGWYAERKINGIITFGNTGDVKVKAS